MACREVAPTDRDKVEKYTVSVCAVGEKVARVQLDNHQSHFQFYNLVNKGNAIW